MPLLDDVLQAIRTTLENLPDAVASAIGGSSGRGSRPPLGSGPPTFAGTVDILRKFAHIGLHMGHASSAIGKFSSAVYRATAAIESFQAIKGIIGRLVSAGGGGGGPQAGPWRQIGAAWGAALGQNGILAAVASMRFAGMSPGVFAASIARRAGVTGLVNATGAAHAFFGRPGVQQVIGLQAAQGIQQHLSSLQKYFSSGSFAAHFGSATTKGVQGIIDSIGKFMSPITTGGGPGWTRVGMTIARGMGVAGIVVGTAAVAVAAGNKAGEAAEHRLAEAHRQSYMSPQFQAAYATLQLHDVMRDMEIGRRTGASASALAEAVDRMRDAQVESNVRWGNLKNILGAGGAGFNRGMNEGFNAWYDLADKAFGVDSGFAAQVFEDFSARLGNFLFGPSPLIRWMFGLKGGPFGLDDGPKGGNVVGAWHLNEGLVFAQARIIPDPRHPRNQARRPGRRP